MKILTFKGGLHPDDCKSYTKDKPIREIKPSDIMVYPMSQHIGAVCEPIVKKGDRVLVGQKIGDSDAFVSSPVHSTVSGTVVAVEKRLHPNGSKVMSVVVQNDGLDEYAPEIKQNGGASQGLTKAEKLKRIRECGVVGLGGATFPTHIKLSPPPDKTIDCIIVNGAECEPYLTSDYRVMLETPKLVFDGLKIMMDITGVKRAVIGIENNKPEAIDIMTKIAKNYDGVTVAALKTKYPQGSEKHLIKAVLNREVPSGKLPADAGCIVDNVDTCIAVYNAVERNMPVLTRIITVSGSGVLNPQNLRVRVGTGFDDILKEADFNEEKTKKIIAGGPMMGIAVYSVNVPTVKGTSAILAFGDREINNSTKQVSPCIRCGCCVEKCPMHLMPLMLNSYAKAKDYDACLKYHIGDCIECGICSYNCQSNVNPLQNIKTAKKIIAAMKRKTEVRAK